MKLSVISPVLNEAFFLPLYLRSVLAYADEVCLLDGGSSDGTYETIKLWQKRYKKIRVWQIPQTGLPYSPDWQEGKRRQYLLEQTRGDWVLALDCDEFMGDSFKGALPFLMGNLAYDLYEFSYLPFWRDINTLRLSSKGDPHWAGTICRLGRREGLSYQDEPHHSHLLFAGLPLWEHQRRAQLPWLKLYHYHYALGSRLKYNDNRRGDLACLDNMQNPDWDHQPLDYKIITKRFLGKHPKVIRDYLKKGRVNEDFVLG